MNEKEVYKVRAEGRQQTLDLWIKTDSYANAQTIADAVADADGKPIPWELEETIVYAYKIK